MCNVTKWGKAFVAILTSENDGTRSSQPHKMAKNRYPCIVLISQSNDSSEFGRMHSARDRFVSVSIYPLFWTWNWLYVGPSENTHVGEGKWSSYSTRPYLLVL